ncbi:MAG: oxygen-independent coproporphyrinogen III oxidase-like protein, partial [Rhodoferax sp.]|nr:oxygen-independent coproporphyrinogen III oxidase-like protein [Rhodoferax sp.]
MPTIPLVSAEEAQQAAIAHDIQHYLRPGSLQLPALPPLALYIHIPWCLKKCPYCDFNSHAAPGESLPEQRYLDALLADLDAALP